MKKIILTLATIICIGNLNAQNYTYNSLPINSAGNPFVSEAVGLGNNVILSAFSVDNNVGKELFISDGTPAGTKLLKDIWPGGGDGNPQNLTLVGNKVFFCATDPVYGTAVWVTDGTIAGTMIWNQMNTASLNPDFKPGFGFTEIGNGAIVYFRYNGTTNFYDLVYDDGSQNGPQQILGNPSGDVINPNDFSIYDSPTENIINYNGKVYFSGTNGATAKVLWQTDGTAGGTVSFSEQEAGLRQTDFTIMNNKLYFLVQGDGITPAKGFYRTDGTFANTIKLNNLPNSITTFVYDLFAYNNNLYFYVEQSPYIALNKSDGLTSGSLSVVQASGGSALNAVPMNNRKDNIQCIGKILCPSYDLSNKIGDVSYFDGNTTFNLVSNISADGFTHLRHNLCVGNENYMAAYTYNGANITKSTILTTGSGGSVVIDVYAPGATNANPIDPNAHFTGFTKAGNKIFFMANFSGTDWRYYSLENKSTTDINSIENGNLSLVVYPNPTMQQLNFANTNDYNLFTITDVFGKVVMKEPCKKDKNSVSLSNLPNGLYNIQVTGNKGTQSAKFIKEY
jgi:ELWxxDGT repeat protein